MLNTPITSIFTIVLCVLSIFFTVNCTQKPKNPDEEFLQASTLRVVTRNGPTTYYRNSKGEWIGPETEMVTAFARYLGKKVTFEAVANTKEILEGLQQSKWHLAAAGITTTTKRRQLFSFSPSYQKIRQQLVCHQSVPAKKITDLKGKTLIISSGTSYEENLTQLQKNKYPWLKWQASAKLSTEEILNLISQHKVDCAVADSNIVMINQRFFPEIKVRRPMSPTEELAWALNPSTPSLGLKASQWFSLKSTKKLIKNILDKYYAHAPRLNNQSTQYFHQQIKEQLPQRQFTFKKLSQKNKLPWTLIAALDYTETQWSSPISAKDPLGITPTTALGITSHKTTLKERIQLLKIQIQRLPKEFDEDLIWLALASYKIGLAHIEDAIELSKKDPNFSYKWSNIRHVLPKLVNVKFNHKLKNGYAQGLYAIKFVDNVKNYFEILNQISVNKTDQ